MSKNLYKINYICCILSLILNIINLNYSILYKINISVWIVCSILWIRYSQNIENKFNYINK